MRWTKPTEVACSDCGELFVRKALNSKRCPECQHEHRKSAWRERRVKAEGISENRFYGERGWSALMAAILFQACHDYVYGEHYLSKSAEIWLLETGQTYIDALGMGIEVNQEWLNKLKKRMVTKRQKSASRQAI